MKAKKAIAVKLLEESNSKTGWVGPYLMTTREYDDDGQLNPGKIKAWWYFGPSCTYLYEGRYVLVKDYGFVDDYNPDDYRYLFADEVYQQFDPNGECVIEMLFTREFVEIIPSSPVERGGWIAPNGNFYACRYGEHISIASALAKLLYRSFNGAKKLEDEGWLHLDETGIVQNTKPESATQAQLNTIGDLIVIGSPDFSRHLNYFISRLQP